MCCCGLQELLSPGAAAALGESAMRAVSFPVLHLTDKSSRDTYEQLCSRTMRTRIQMNIQVNRKNTQTGRKMSTYVNTINKCMHETTTTTTTTTINQLINRTNKQTNERTNERTNGRTDGRSNVKRPTTRAKYHTYTYRPSYAGAHTKK